MEWICRPLLPPSLPLLRVQLPLLASLALPPWLALLPLPLPLPLLRVLLARVLLLCVRVLLDRASLR